MTGQERITAGLLIIGDEILSGRTKDKNIGYIAEYLTNIGIELSEVRVVPDKEARIVEAVNALRAAYTYVFTTGGIGPTHDDITADSMAAAFGLSIDIDPRAVEMMRERFREQDLTPARLRMARIPDGAVLIDNVISKTPGFMLDNVIVMAGIPRVMHVMLDAVAPDLKTGQPMISRSIRVDRPESEVALGLRQTQGAFPDVSMGSYPFYEKGVLGTYLVLRSTDPHRLDKAETALSNMLRASGLIA